MALDDLRAELERLYELDELIALSRDLLGLDPQRIGGSAAITLTIVLFPRPRQSVNDPLAD